MLREFHEDILNTRVFLLIHDNFNARRASRAVVEQSIETSFQFMVANQLVAPDN